MEKYLKTVYSISASATQICNTCLEFYDCVVLLAKFSKLCQKIAFENVFRRPIFTKLLVLVCCCLKIR